MRKRGPNHHFRAKSPKELVQEGLITIIALEIAAAPFTSEGQQASQKRVRRLLAWWKRRPGLVLEAL